MSDSHTPWPAWATVMIVCALIAGAFEIKKAQIEANAKSPILVSSQPAPPPAAPAGAIVPANAMASAPVEFTIHNTIGPTQTEESVRILLDGRYIGTLQITRAQPSATLKWTVPGPGRYSWSASSSATFVNENGEPFQYSGSGQGIVFIDSGTSFDLRSTYSGPTWTIDMERDDVAPLQR